MSDSVIVALVNGHTNNLAYVPPLIVTDEGSIVVHESPRVLMHKGESRCNFDLLVHVDFTVNYDWTKASVLADKYKFIPIETKLEQYCQIQAFNNAYPDHQIDTPKALFGEGRPDDLVNPLLVGNVGIPGTDYVVVKPQVGARGNNQLRIPAHNLSTVLNYGAGLTAS